MNKDRKQPLHNLEERTKFLTKTIKSDFSSLKVDIITELPEPLD